MVRVLATASDTDGTTEVARALTETGFAVEAEEPLRREYVQPFVAAGEGSATDRGGDDVSSVPNDF